MGYLARYRKEAQEKGLPNWQNFYIAEIEETSEAILVYHNPHGYWKDGQWIVTRNPYPELPITFSSYEDAFAYFESNLTKRAPDGAQVCRNCGGLVGVIACSCDSATPETPRR